MKVLQSGVTQPKGFLANGIASGIKRSGKLDLSLIFSKTPAIGAAVFTKNSIKAAPLLVSQKNIRNGNIQAIVTNSGNANCFTGKFGILYAQETAKSVAQHLAIKPNDVFVLSTGIIGKALPYKKIKKAIPKLSKSLSIDGASKAAKAIMTTDTVEKQIAVELILGGKKVAIAGCAKGSGMVAPNMATMLGMITTDANIQPRLLKLALKVAVDQSFNSITIDGCMSTNDTVVIMANGCAKNKKISTEGSDFKKFQIALNHACLDLAKKIILDAEGATKFIDIQITQAKSAKQAKTIGLAIANSMLVKTAAFGSNPNWGRVAQAVGALGLAQVKEENLKISFSSFKKKEITINVSMGLGKGNATVFTSDLSYDYIKINGEYN